MSATETKPGRISWITGLKGLSCYVIFLHHLLINIDITIYQGGPSGNAAWLLSSTPVGIVANGNFYLFLFFVLSTYLIGNSFIHYDRPDLRGKIGTFCIKRYFRLMLPILAYAVLRHSLVLLWNGIWGNCPLPAYPDWKFVIKHSLYTVFAENDTGLTGPLWMMHVLFTGSYVALLLSLPDRKTGKAGIFLSYGIALAFSLLQRNFYLAAIVSGVLLVDVQPLWQVLPRRWLPKVLLLLGLFFGSVPTAVVPEPFFLYRFTPSHPEFWHCLGAFLVIWSLLGEQSLPTRLLSAKPLQFLGKISYPMFLVHEAVLILLFNPIRNLCRHLSGAATVGVLILVISAAVILLSWLFYEVIEKNTNKLCSRIRI